TQKAQFGADDCGGRHARPELLPEQPLLMRLQVHLRLRKGRLRTHRLLPQGVGVRGKKRPGAVRVRPEVQGSGRHYARGGGHCIDGCGGDCEGHGAGSVQKDGGERGDRQVRRRSGLDEAHGGP
ncbi:unnamed protein product, partial [Effrenium voratum]